MFAHRSISGSGCAAAEGLHMQTYTESLALGFSHGSPLWVTNYRPKPTGRGRKNTEVVYNVSNFSLVSSALNNGVPQRAFPGECVGFLGASQCCRCCGILVLFLPSLCAHVPPAPHIVSWSFALCCEDVVLFGTSSVPLMMFPGMLCILGTFLPMLLQKRSAEEKILMWSLFFSFFSFKVRGWW